MHDQSLAASSSVQAEADRERIARVEAERDALQAERDALQAEVARLQRREQERRARVAEKRASGRRATRDGFEKPPVPQAGTMEMLIKRTHALTDPAEIYLDLLKSCLTRLPFGERSPIDARTGQYMAFDANRRIDGSDWPSEAETMVGLQRLDNVQQCVADVLWHKVPGDLVETGVWRGGVAILMRAMLKIYGDTERTVWAADSFAGLPVPDAERYPADEDFDLSPEAGFNVLAVPVDEVRTNFARYGLLDEQVRFLVGWFKDTLPTAPIEQIAVLRLDGDLYESTMDALTALYPKLSVGGYLIIDDYLEWEPCRLAVNDYRAAHGITEPILPIDWMGVYWRRER